MTQVLTNKPGTVTRLPVQDPDLAALDAIVAGNRIAFDELYRRYYPRLMDFLARVVNHRELAEEVVNDTMYTVWTAGASFAHRSKVSTWIFGIAYKKALKRIERDKRVVTESLNESHEVAVDADFGAELDAVQLRGTLDRAMTQLSVAHRSVVELTYLMDYSYEEIAEIVGCPVNTVKTRMFHARARLRRLLTALWQVEKKPV
ncbi:MAG: RNA polymerase sigma factor [Gammaproteobacteria bacterium]